MNSKSKLEELDALVSDMYDDGLSAAELRRLESLLLQDADAQEHYCRLAAVHVALGVSGNSSAPASETPLRSEGESTLVDDCGPCSTSPGRRSVKWVAWFLALAATVMAAAMFWPHNSPDTTAHQTETESPYKISSIPMITHVSWEGPAFSRKADAWQPAATISAGAVSLKVNEGKAADGYLFRLPPGEAVELFATFDATGENSLSIVEITGGDKPTIQKLTFHNTGEGPKPLHANPAASNRRYGVLGHWSETNTSKRARFFLLTGVHKLALTEKDDQWRVSEMAVLMETPSAVHVGWDDSGPAPTEGHPYEQDNDFDDLSASIFFSPLDEASQSVAPSLDVLAKHSVEDLQLPENLDGGFEFELPPNAAVMLKAVSEATDPNALGLIDVATNEMLWSSLKEITEPTYLGTTCVENRTVETKHLRLVALHRLRGEDPAQPVWHLSSMRTLYEQPNYQILGFEDSQNDQDFNDVRVTVLIVSKILGESRLLQAR